MKLEQQKKIWREFHEGKEQTNGRKYAYTLEYIERYGERPWKIIRAMKDGSTSWEEVQQLDIGLQFVPTWSKTRLYSIHAN